MDSEQFIQQFSDIIGILACLAPLCLGLALFLGFAGFLIWFINRQLHPKDATALASDRAKMQAELNRLTPNLRSWSSESLVHLSTDWDADWMKIGRDLSAHGTIPSVADPKGPALVAFSLRARGAINKDGQMLASTSAQTIAYRLTAKSIIIQVDGAPFGSVKSDGTLLDANGQIIGSATRPNGLPFILSFGGLSYAHDDRAREYPVYLHDRTVARITNHHVRLLNVLVPGEEDFPPAVAIDDSPSKADTEWLLALAILQVAGFNLTESIWMRPSSV